MKAKYALLLLIAGFLLGMVGALLKIMHWPGADITLLSALGCEVVAAIGFLIKLLKQPKTQ